jgi:hypothetical protein
MIVFLFVVGTKMLTCLYGGSCHEIIGIPDAVIAAGGFEFVSEFFGIMVYRKIVGRKDK